MTFSAAHFEAKKHAYRQTQDGIVISFVVHPNDLDAALAIAPLGARYMIAVAQIGDDERPIAPAPVARKPEPAALPAPPVADTSERRKFASLPLPQQIGIRCADRAFQAWIGAIEGMEICDEKAAADWVRHQCEVETRADIQPCTPAAELWSTILTNFERDTNRMAEIRS